MDVEWFKARKKELGITDAVLATALGVERSVANKVTNGHVAINPRRIEGVADLLQVDRDELMFRIGMVAAPVRTLSPDLPVPRTADAGETVEIIRLDLSLPMGPGASVEDYVEEEPLRFDLGYVREFTRTPPHRLRLARGVGDSMFPTLLNSDVVWIDSTQTTLNQADKVWAVSINGAAAIKRLRPLREGKVLVISDNPNIENYEVAGDEIRIGGRVIRFARDL